MGLKIWLGIIFKLRHATMCPAYFLGPFGGTQVAPKYKMKQRKNLFSGCFEPFLLKEWARFLSLKKAPNQLIRPILLGEIVRNNQKTGF
jgi:hypothetical protein